MAYTNWWVTDFNAFYNKGKSTLSIECIVTSKLYVLSYESMNEMCEKIPKMNKHRICGIARESMHLMIKSAQELYEDLIKKYPKIEQESPKLLSAKYLGASRETLSRLHYKT